MINRHYVLNINVGYVNKTKNILPIPCLNTCLTLVTNLDERNRLLNVLFYDDLIPCVTLASIDVRSFKGCAYPYQDGGSVDAFVP